MEKETWKRIDEFPDYFVSTHGRVKSVKKGIEHIMKPHVRNYGRYLYVCLWKNGKVKKYSIHRLVAQAFIANPAGLPCVNHIDENRYNNVVSNLEWCSITYNNNFGTGNKRRSTTLLNRGDQSKPIRQLTLEGEVIATYPSAHEAVRLSGMSLNAIWCSANGITKKPRKYKWEYIV